MGGGDTTTTTHPPAMSPSYYYYSAYYHDKFCCLVTVLLVLLYYDAPFDTHFFNLPKKGYAPPLYMEPAFGFCLIWWGVERPAMFGGKINNRELS